MSHRGLFKGHTDLTDLTDLFSKSRRNEENKRNVFKCHTDLTDDTDLFSKSRRNEGNKGNGAAPDLSRMVNFCYFFYFCGTK